MTELKKIGNKLHFNVFLLGPRRVGKTSILASMISSFKDVAHNTHIHIDPDKDTEKLLQDSRIKLQKVHESYRRHGIYSHFSMDESPNRDSNDYTFEITYDSADGGTKKNMAQVVFKDRPGEWLTEDEHEEEIISLLDETDVLLVAIDTIQMMEEGGAFCESMHRTMILQNYLMNSQFLNGDMQKMVLFVPLKCERYYHEGRMDEVNEAVHKHFKQIIDVVTTSAVAERTTAAITPILTMGGIEFDSIGRNEKNEIPVVKDKTHYQLNSRIRSEYIFYRYYKADPKFTPKYCEQPVIYLLYYIASLANAQNQVKKQKKMFFFGSFLFAVLVAVCCFISDIMKDENVAVSLDMLKSKIKRAGDGYEIINNHLNI